MNALNRLKVNSKDDVLIIDFGINDSISSLNKIAIDEMKQYMSEMAAMAKEKGAVPVLVSPVYNSKYQHKHISHTAHQQRLML